MPDQSPHTCEACDALPLVCKAAVIKHRDQLMTALTDDYSEPGAYWKKQFLRIREISNRGAESNRLMQLHMQRLESRVLKAEKALARYERYQPYPEDDTDPEGRADVPHSHSEV